MKLRNIPLEHDTFCEGEEAERILKLHEFTERTGAVPMPDDELSTESPDDQSPNHGLKRGDNE